MFWTKIVRGWNKFFLVLGILGSIITGFALMDEVGGFASLIMLAGVIVSFVSVSVIMMISEISVSLHELIEINRNNQSGNASLMHQTAETVIHTKQRVDDSWVCRCGSRNPNTAKFCKKCGTSRSEIVSADTSANRDVWICPNCNDVNPMSSRICKGCGKDK